MVSEASGALPSGSQSDAIFQGLIRRWHAGEPELLWDVVQRRFPSDPTALTGRIHQLGLINCFQWHLEDECRSHYTSQPVLADLKHNIDLSNQRRMEAIDGIDDEYSRRLQSRVSSSEHAQPALVTPGSLLDRISILELKRYHVECTDASALALGARTAPLLAEQIEELCTGTDAFVQDLLAGRLRLKIYPSIKLYGRK